MAIHYQVETLGDDEDDGTIVSNVDDITASVVGRRIVSAGYEEVKAWGEAWEPDTARAFVITLDNGTQVQLFDSSDCCAHTTLEGFFLAPDSIDHMIMGVGTTDKYETWHIYADWGDILRLEVGWSAGNPFYYGYGFDIRVVPKAVTVGSQFYVQTPVYILGEQILEGSINCNGEVELKEIKPQV